MPTRTESQARVGKPSCFQVMKVEERISPSIERVVPTAALALVALVVLGPAGRGMAASYTLTTLASFNGANGADPSGGLALDAQSNLFGTTEFGGAGNQGTVFVIPAGTRAIDTLASFNYTNGANPLGDPVLDAQGNLFGTTANGGANGRGTAFEIAAGSRSLTTLTSFNFANGAAPQGGLALDAQGNLFGTTANGGANGRGTAFEIAAGSRSLTTLASFNGANGAGPRAGPVLDAQGNLFGTTQLGGANNAGTIFEIAAGSRSLTTLASFSTFVSGGGPSGGLALDAQGNLFGTTTSGGAHGLGTVFELSPTAVVAAPASLVLMGLGLAGLAALALVTAQGGGAA